MHIPPRGIRRSRAAALSLWAAGALLIGTASWGCSSAQENPPRPGDVRGGVPNLSGVSVMVLPVQIRRGVDREIDAEIGYALRSRGRIEWIFPDQLRSALTRSPGLNVNLDTLAVAVFLQAEVQRVGDPLFGELRRLSALTRADYALIPVEARRGEPDDAGVSRAELVVALVHTRDGRVRWFAVLEGDPGDPGDPRTVASLAEGLARTVAP